MGDSIDLISSEGDRLLAVARQDIHRQVPQYPGWTMSDLLSHTGSVLGRTTMIVRDRLQERPTSPKMEEGGDAFDWFSSSLGTMCDVLRASNPEIPVWGFGPGPNVGFWVDRMMIEVGVHRWDAEQAYGRPLPLLDEVVTAGLDEFPDMWMPHLGDITPIKVVATDMGKAWSYGHGDPIHTIEASGSDLYLRLMSRNSPASFPDDWESAVDSLSPPPR
ncbi:MAG TPA: maleylpyruvate isomerase family mycothiol-dependent enzyme [Acidimicrobiia bacterium]